MQLFSLKKLMEMIGGKTGADIRSDRGSSSGFSPSRLYRNLKHLVIKLLNNSPFFYFLSLSQCRVGFYLKSFLCDTFSDTCRVFGGHLYLHLCRLNKADISRHLQWHRALPNACIRRAFLSRSSFFFVYEDKKFSIWTLRVPFYFDISPLNFIFG